MAAVVSKTEETNTVTDYFVSCLAGPRVARQRVVKGQKLRLTEHQARGELASGALVASEDRVDDPWGEAAAAKIAAAEKVAADAKVAEVAEAAEKVRAAADAQAAADRAAEEAAALQHHDDAPAADQHA